MIARPRLNHEAFLIVLEALAELYRLTTRKRKLRNKDLKLGEIYFLFWGIADKKIGRRSSWGWRWEYDKKPMRAYKQMLDKIKEIESKPEKSDQL